MLLCVCAANNAACLYYWTRPVRCPIALSATGARVDGPGGAARACRRETAQTFG
jgi:hypothetical protein